MTRTIIIPLGDPEEDQAGIVEQAVGCTSLFDPAGEASLVLLSAVDSGDAVEERQAYLDRIAATADRPVSTVVERGDAATVILDFAARQVDPLIVIASHGRAGVARRTIGSVATRVAREASVPVVIMPGWVHATAPVCTVLRRVLVPINDPERADAIVDATLAALGPLATPQVEFHLAEVVEPIDPQPAVASFHGSYEGAREVPAHFLRGVAQRLARRGYQGTWELRIGDSARELVQLAREQDINLIVLPAQGRQGFNDLIPETVAEEARSTQVTPLLVIQV